MKLAGNECKMTCIMVLEEEEIDMLAWLAGYGPETISKAITGKLGGKFSSEKWEKLWTGMHNELGRQTKLFQDTRAVFRESKQAREFERDE